MAPTKVAGTAKKTTTRKPTTPPSTETVLRRDLARLVTDVRAALDELAVRGDLATMEGRDRLQEQVDEVETRWWKVKQELGLAKSDSEATLETVRAAITKAEEAVRHVVDAVFEGVRKR
jgi:hypothetical protein